MTTIITAIITALLASFSTLIVALLSGYIGWHLHMRLRVEKLKEILYKERLALYKEILNKLWSLHHIAIECIHGADKKNELRREALDFLDFISRKRLIISEHLYEKCIDFFKLCIIKIQISHDIREMLSIVNEVYRSISNIMREELGIEILSKDIESQLETIIKEWKNETDAETNNHSQKPDRNQKGEI